MTGSPVWVGVIFGVPAILSFGPTLIGGALADRVSKRDVIIVTRLAVASSAFVLALISVQDALSIWLLFLVVVFGRIAHGIGWPSSSTMIAEIVPESELSSGNAGHNVVRESTEIAGAGVGGIVLGTAGVTPAFFAIAIVYTVSALMMFLVSARTPPAPTDDEQPKRGYHEAFSFLRGDRLLQFLFVMVLVDFFTAIMFPLMPIYADEVLDVGEAGFGTMMASLAVGGLLGGLFLLRVGNSMNAPKALVLGNVGWGVGMFGIILSDQLAVTTLIIVFMGVASAFSGVAWASLALSAMPADIRGRLFGIFHIAMQAFYIGAITAGVIATHVSLNAAMAIGAIGSILLPTIVWLMSPTFRNAVVDSES